MPREMKSWMDVVSLRDDLLTGELPLSMFAADLYDVSMNTGAAVYSDPSEFFSMTYPSISLRDLVADIMKRLQGKSDRAVRVLELTYGGGKTHTLITLFHMTRTDIALPRVGAVDEFLSRAGLSEPVKAATVVLPFDKIDVEKGMETRSPEGKVKVLRHPWSIMAWQLAGPDGLKILHPEDLEEERDSAPAQPLLEKLFGVPAQRGLPVLVLLDEVLMYARGKVAKDKAWKDKLQDFFQGLTQAAVKSPSCAVVASLLSSDPRDENEAGREVLHAIQTIFGRVKDESVMPVGRKDVAEVLRRRFFKLDSVRDPSRYAPHVIQVVQALGDTIGSKGFDQGDWEERVTQSFPFHPELTDVFFEKWIQLDGFQRTRGILRTLAIGLRDAAGWDRSPIIGAEIFLPEGKVGDGLPEALRELANTAHTEDIEGTPQDWKAILLGELKKASAIQTEFPSLTYRELEQSVVATFLHSQPIGKKATSQELFTFVGGTAPDRIDLEKALLRWCEESWFLDEEETLRSGSDTLPKHWRMGSKPNLRHIHAEAYRKITDMAVHDEIASRIGKLNLKDAKEAGAEVHNQPSEPSNISDDATFRIAVMGSEYACAEGSVSADVSRFIEHKSTSGNPRQCRNSVILIVPKSEGIGVVEDHARHYLAWEEVKNHLPSNQMDEVRKRALTESTSSSRNRFDRLIESCWRRAVLVDPNNEVRAHSLKADSATIFQALTDDPQETRVFTSPLNPEALLPGGPYDLWRQHETESVQVLAESFARFARLPKVVNASQVMETLKDGISKGFFVLRLRSGDGTVFTWWNESPPDEKLKHTDSEIVLPEKASLSRLDPGLLAPGAIPTLWPDDTLLVSRLYEMFDGTHVVKIPKGGYDEPFAIPRAETPAVDRAIHEAVLRGVVWLVQGVYSYCEEEIPESFSVSQATLKPPPGAVSPTDLLPGTLKDAYTEGETTLERLRQRLSEAKFQGTMIPWRRFVKMIGSAVSQQMLRVVSGNLDVGPEAASTVVLQYGTTTSSGDGGTPPPPLQTPTARGSFSKEEFGEVDFDELLISLQQVLGTDGELKVEITFVASSGTSAESLQRMNDVLESKGVQLRFS